MSNASLFLCTCGSDEEATKIARHLLERRLAACVNVIPGIQSHYWWNGEITSDAEILLLIKSRPDLSGDLFAEIRKVHSYDVPELVELPFAGGSPAYLQWLHQELRPAPTGNG